ncbi:tetratricopeptide repeat protein [Frateuria soli]|uniref:tetratricopeptide repeat protein n=1 Tax=Frateuria soli TaxID=1542730 RepID=UPI001E653B12|nr:tetratricopeptide repeat protein [Frateuria soli]UGB38985.1 tetratricopeptide repeat protein [Frateuria soli]
MACLTALAYHPGLHGGFLFDDFANLPALGETGPINRWETFVRYVTSGTADPTGRPIALLSFLLDARNWPADPYPFKRTNLLVHLLNGVLLFLLLRRLGAAATAQPEQDRRRLDAAAVLGAGFWMAHPLFVSTTLYIVQREAMLPATFTLLGLLAWLHGRKRMRERALWQGLVWIVTGLGACTMLAVLSKANGILLPVLALTLEFAFLHPCDRAAHRANAPSSYRRAMLLFGWLPTLAIVAYLLHAGWHGLTVGISDARQWTLGQRLLTEPRVLLTYLHMLWLPTPFTAGLFNDQVKASTSLLHPWTTLPSLLAIAALIAFAWKGRNRWPAVAAAVLFFFVGQSIESSTIALELFFEHRNYLPALLMFWPLALWLCGCNLMTRQSTEQSAHTSWHRSKLVLAAVCLATLLTMTWSRASLWGNTHDQALLWARLNPSSARAQAFAAQAEMSAGHPRLAIRRLEPALRLAPDQVQLALNLVAARCAAGNLNATSLTSAEQALATTRDTGTLLTNWFDRAINEATFGKCPAIGLAEIKRLLLAARQNPRLVGNPGRQQDIDYLLGRLAIKQGEPEQALTLFDAGLRQQPRESLALSQAAELGSAGFPAQGLAHLAYFQSLPPPPKASGWSMARLHAYVLARQDYWPRELARLRDTLQKDLKDSYAPPG